MKSASWTTLIMPVLAFTFIITACDQNKGTPPPQPEAEKQAFPGDKLPNVDLAPPSNMPLHPPAGTPVKKSVKSVSVPDAVKGQWESVVLRIEDKTNQTSVDQTLALHSDYQPPDSNITIKVGDFLPQFTMNEQSITSISNETKNPALKITVVKEGEEVFSGWLFENFPEMHPFQDERFAVKLVGYNPKAPSEPAEKIAE